MPRPKKTDTFIKDTLRAEMNALKRQIENFERESEHRDAAVKEAEARGREAQRADAQIAEDRRVLGVFCRLVGTLPWNLVLSGQHMSFNETFGTKAPATTTIGTDYLQDIAARIQRMGVT